MMKTQVGTPDDLAYLRAESLWPVLLGVMVTLYLWHMVLFHPANSLGVEAWGPVLLGVGLVVAFVVRKRNISWASAALIGGIVTANLSHMWWLDSSVAPYLLAIAVSLTGLLFGLRAVAGVTVLCSSAVILIGVTRWGHSPFSTELLSPVLVIVLVGVSSSLTVRNLYLTLYWAWDRAMTAQAHEDQLLDRQGELARALKALDVAYTQLERLNYDLALAREAAESARQAKQQFATNISHELRTPLNVIMAFSEMMYLSPGSYGEVTLPRPYRGDIREIYRSSKYLLQLTEDVLNLSKIEAHEMKIHPEPARLHEVVTEAAGIIRPLLRGQTLALRVELPEDLPPVVIDRARVGQVLLNLLNNARRFTRQGSICVRAAPEGNWVKVTVADTGVGIPPAEIHKVFKEFGQLDNAMAQDGSGLGLVISKRFIEMHGGRIWAESEGIPGRGTRFHFTLPIKAPLRTEVVSVEAPLRVRTPTGRGRTILLLDQDPYLVKLLEEGLPNCQVVPVEDVSQISDLMLETHPRAIVLNLMQKHLAWRQLRALRDQVESVHLPVVLCPLVSPKDLGQTLGVADYLVKPVTRQALINLLARLGTDIRRILVVDDDPRMRNLLKRLLQANSGEYEIIWAGNGQEGLHKMEAQPPDLVLMDLSMPHMDGYTLLAHMRQTPHLNQIPVAVLTAHTGTPEEERRLGGQSLFVSNPAGFTNEDVLNYLHHLLEATNIPSPLRSPGHTIQQGQQVGLGNRLV